jgi:hypothetical protein
VRGGGRGVDLSHARRGWGRVTETRGDYYWIADASSAPHSQSAASVVGLGWIVGHRRGED